MNKIRLWVAALAVVAAWQVAAAEYQLKVDTDRPAAVYELGESAGFVVEALCDGEASRIGELVFTIDNDRNNRNEWVYRRAPWEGDRVEFALSEPGFAFCRVAWLIDGAEVAAGETAAAFAPELIRQGRPEPADFDAFWAAGRKEAEAVRLAAGDDYARLTPAPELATATLDVWKVNFANVGDTRLWGFLSVPKEGEGPFPAVVVVPGASPASKGPGGHVLEGVITLFINVHDYDPDTGECPPDYPLIGAADRGINFFRRAWLGMDQAAEWLRSHPKFDGKNLGVCGFSQGGGSTLALAALNPNFVFAVANQPALCDFGAESRGGRSGWPFFINNFRDRPEVMAEVAYIDCANFAGRITCPIIVLAGFIDVACAPGSIYAAYNNIPAEGKSIVNQPNTNHTWGVDYNNARAEMVAALRSPEK